jgi:hypothetical protein
VENRRQNERRLNMTFDWSVYSGNLTWLPERTIYLTKHGSHSYGTNIPTSDLDIRGIAVPPRNYYIGLTNNFEQASVEEPDMVIFEIRKFLKLASECNPNALEIIFTEPEDHLLMTPAAELLIENRDLFLTKRAKHTFQGYAHAQMKRILTHRRWLLNPVEHQPTRKECGLPERTIIPQDQISAANSAIKKKIDEWSWKEMDDLDPALRQSIHTEFYNRLVEITSWQDDEIESKTWRAAANTLSFDTNFIEFLDKERLYTNKYKEWKQYQEWKKNRNPKTAELEAKYQFDPKHAMHLSRLSRACKELLLTGKLNVRRPDAEELIAIRNGAWTFEYLCEWFEKQSKEIEEAEKISLLPKAPNHDKIDKLSVKIIELLW